MIRLDAELRDQNIRIAEERGRPELADQKAMVGNPIMITDSVKQRLRRLLSGFAKKSGKKGGDGSRSISNNRVSGREVGGPHDLSGGQS